MGSASAAESIAFFDLNTGFSETGDPVQITHPSSDGQSTLYQQRADIDGDGIDGAFVGTAYSNPSLGIASAAGAGLLWDDRAKSGDNDAEFFVLTSTSGYKDIQIHFNVRGDGIDSFDFKYDFNSLQDTPTNLAANGDPEELFTIKDFLNGDSFRPDQLDGTNVSFSDFPVDAVSGFTNVTYDLSPQTDINNQPVFAFRIDDLQGNNAIIFDNVLITGTAVPEPGTCAMLALISAGMIGRRRRTAARRGPLGNGQ